MHRFRGAKSTHMPSSSTNFCEKSLTTHLIPLRMHLLQLVSPDLNSQRILWRLHSAPAIHCVLVYIPSPWDPSDFSALSRHRSSLRWFNGNTHRRGLWRSSVAEVVRQVRWRDGDHLFGATPGPHQRTSAS